MTVRFLVGDAGSRMSELADGSVDLVMTSPPYLALRSYLPPGHPDKGREVGSEPTPAAFIDTLLSLVGECRRVLAPYGSICVELGDTYAGSGGSGGDYAPGGLRSGQARWQGSAAVARTTLADGRRSHTPWKGERPGWPLDKSLTGVPHAFALSLAYGRNVLDPSGGVSPAGRWRVRNVVVWAKPNPAPGALGDKYRPATSYLSVATLARDRWFDLDAVRRPNPRSHEAHRRTDRHRAAERGGHRETNAVAHQNPAGAPPLDWWEIPSRGYPGAHYATYPAALCERPIQSMCPRRVCTACGSPSRRITARRQNRTGRTTNGRKPRDRRTFTDATCPTRTEAAVTTTGWTTCGCPGADALRPDGYHDGPGWRPGVVLDPFAGTGTTLLVAYDLGRDAIGIDIDARNAALAKERVGMFLQVDDRAPDGERAKSRSATPRQPVRPSRCTEHAEHHDGRTR